MKVIATNYTNLLTYIVIEKRDEIAAKTNTQNSQVSRAYTPPLTTRHRPPTNYPHSHEEAHCVAIPIIVFLYV